MTIVYIKDDKTYFLKGIKNQNNFLLKGVYTNMDYYKSDKLTVYKYFIKLTDDKCGLPVGLKVVMISFNNKIDMIINKRYVFKHLTYSERYNNFQYKHNFSLHYLDDNTEPKEGPAYTKITQFF